MVIPSPPTDTLTFSGLSNLVCNKEPLLQHAAPWLVMAFEVPPSPICSSCEEIMWKRLCEREYLRLCPLIMYEPGLDGLNSLWDCQDASFLFDFFKPLSFKNIPVEAFSALFSPPRRAALSYSTYRPRMFISGSVSFFKLFSSSCLFSSNVWLHFLFMRSLSCESAPISCSTDAGAYTKPKQLKQLFYCSCLGFVFRKMAATWHVVSYLPLETVPFLSSLNIGVRVLSYSPELQLLLIL